MREWPALAGEISGFGTQMPGYEAGCRRMVLTAADWLDQHPRVFLDWHEHRVRVPGTPDDKVFIAAAWEEVIRPQNPRTRELCRVLHEACCAAQGDTAGPSYAMMQKALLAAQFIQKNGWDAYVSMMAGRRDDAALM